MPFGRPKDREKERPSKNIATKSREFFNNIHPSKSVPTYIAFHGEKRTSVFMFPFYYYLPTKRGVDGQLVL